jgi:DNA-directed RNA polymerase subunit RPC12/RpoP
MSQTATERFADADYGTVREAGALNPISSRRDAHPMTLTTDHDGDLRHEGADDSNEIRCPICGSPAFMYPRALDDDKPVICAGCGAFVLTYGEMKRHSEDG